MCVCVFTGMCACVQCMWGPVVVRVCGGGGCRFEQVWVWVWAVYAGEIADASSCCPCYVTKHVQVCGGV